MLSPCFTNFNGLVSLIPTNGSCSQGQVDIGDPAHCLGNVLARFSCQDPAPDNRNSSSSTPLKFNSEFPLKNDGWKTMILSFWDPKELLGDELFGGLSDLSDPSAVLLGLSASSH